MKRLILFLVLVPALALAQFMPWLSSAKGPSGSGGGGGSSYLVDENFEGAGTPSGWSITGFSPTYSTAPITGLQSLHKPQDWATYTAEKTFTAQDEVWVYLTAKFGGTYNTFYVLNGGATSLASIYVDDGTYMYFNFEGAVGGNWVAGWSQNTVYHFWIRYVKGTGSNGIVEFYRSTNATKPSSPTFTATYCTSTVQADRVSFSVSNGMEVWVDDVKVSASSIGSNP